MAGYPEQYGWHVRFQLIKNGLQMFVTRVNLFNCYGE